MVVNCVVLLAIGLAGGVIGGLLGIGGSVVMIPLLTLVFGPAQHLYQGAAMMVNFFVALPSVVQHLRARAVLRAVVQVTIPTAVAGVILGVWLSAGAWFHGTNEVYLSRIFGAFLIYQALYNVKRLLSRTRLPDVDPARLSRWKVAGVGIPTGLVGGLLGVGGGIVAVPLQQAVLKMPLRRAIANSAATIVPLSLVGAAYKNYTNVMAGIPLGDSLRLAACMIPMAIVGGFVGARLTHTVPRPALRIAVIALMTYFGIVLLRRTA